MSARPQSKQNQVALHEIVRLKKAGSTAGRLGVALHARFTPLMGRGVARAPHHSTFEAGRSQAHRQADRLWPDTGGHGTLVVKRLFNATIHSLRGLRHSISHETAVRQEAVVLAVAALLGFFVAPSPAWYVAMVGAILIVLAIELLNTAIEALSDHVTPEYHTQIGVIKDAGSAAVFCTLILGALVWFAGIGIRLGFL